MVFKGTVWRDFLLQIFHESSSPKPLKMTLGSFQIFSKIRWVIHKWRCTTGVNNTSGKFATSVNETSGKQWEQYQTADNWQWTCRKKFIYANCTTQRCPRNNENFYDWRVFPFATGVNYTDDAPWLRISQRFSQKFEMALMGKWEGVGPWNSCAFLAPNGIRLSAPCQLTGPKNNANSRAQPLPTCPVMDMQWCTHLKHYARGCVNHMYS